MKIIGMMLLSLFMNGLLTTESRLLLNLQEVSSETDTEQESEKSSTLPIQQISGGRWQQLEDRNWKFWLVLDNVDDDPAFDQNGTADFEHSGMKPVQNQLARIDGTLYYFDEQGLMYKGWKQFDDALFFFDNAGAAKQGWLYQKEAWYFGTEKGMARSCWILDQNRWYHFDEDGVMKTGWILEDGDWYFCDSSGAMIAGRWATIDHHAYYFTRSGAMKTGWLQDPQDHKTYYLKEDGTLAIGWIEDPKDHSWYLTDFQGAIITGDWADPKTGILYAFSDQGQYIRSVPDVVKGIPLINKKHGLPADYAPGENPEAKQHLQKLILQMQSLGYDVSSDYSGYRSYETQRALYASYVYQNGQATADLFSARPGYSEHQSGLAFDLKHWSGALLQGEAEAAWLLDHAHKYGFIVRYQKGWEDITGYMAEPWHIRYIGQEAEDIVKSGLPLEEYLEAEGGDYIQNISEYSATSKG